MTALVFLDYNPGWDKDYTMRREDRREGGRIYLYDGDEVLIKDLFYAALVGSDNTATIALIHSAGMSEEEFVGKMNEKAIVLGMMSTHFEDATGLNFNNKSTAKNIALLAKEALEREEIKTASMTDFYEFKTAGGRAVKITNTNALLFNNSDSNIKVDGGKTGHTDAAGYCYVGRFADENGNEVVSVVLGEADQKSRFTKTKELVAWVFDKYKW